MKCTVKKIGDYKVFDVDGKTVYPGAYMSYAPLQEDIDEMILILQRTLSETADKV